MNKIVAGRNTVSYEGALTLRAFLDVLGGPGPIEMTPKQFGQVAQCLAEGPRPTMDPMVFEFKVPVRVKMVPLQVTV